MFTSQSTIERRAAKEKRMAMAEGRLTTSEERLTKSEERLTTNEGRLSALENASQTAAVDLTPIETRLAALENKPAPVADFGPVETRLATLEAAKPVDLSGIESRLAALEATLKALAARSDDFSEGATDMRRSLDSAEANATLVRKELDELKATKKTGGFTTAAAGTKNFAYSAKKKDEDA